jgi:hypothetical protein
VDYHITDAVFEGWEEGDVANNDVKIIVEIPGHHTLRIA